MMRKAVVCLLIPPLLFLLAIAISFAPSNDKNNNVYIYSNLFSKNVVDIIKSSDAKHIYINGKCKNGKDIFYETDSYEYYFNCNEKYKIKFKDRSPMSIKEAIDDKLITIEDLKNDGIDFSERKKRKLMIVAHPDDETIWGGSHLIEDDYYVVCITCGSSKTRANEFINAMKFSGDNYQMLGYPDVVNKYIDRWDSNYSNILLDLKRIINSENWMSVVTHNPNGEYGHPHHKKTSEIVTSLVSKEKLYYFGKYYDKSKIKNIRFVHLSDEQFSKKNEMFDIYSSQEYIRKKIGHMYKYENFIKSNDWK